MPSQHPPEGRGRQTWGCLRRERLSEAEVPPGLLVQVPRASRWSCWGETRMPCVRGGCAGWGVAPVPGRGAHWRLSVSDAEALVTLLHG